MTEFQHALKKALDWLGKIEEVRVLDQAEKRCVGLTEKIDVWEVTTEITNKSSGIDTIRLHIIFTPDFPLSFPIVLLAKEDYERYKHIPHVQADRLVCTFGNKIQPDPANPDKVVEEVIRRSKHIIEAGIKGDNNREEFLEEFVAYWNGEYSEKDVVLDSALLVIEKPINKNVKLITLDKPYNKIHHIIHTEEDIGKRFITFLDKKKIRYNEVDALFAGEIGILEPPFSITNRKAFDLLHNRQIENNIDYRRFINSKVFPKLILFQKKLGGEVKYFGWFHKPVKVTRNGFRPGSLSNIQVMKTFHGEDLVTRINPEKYSPARLTKRSEGFQNSPKPGIYCLAGLGSIGSNLVHFLNYGPELEFRFVDSDKLKVENLGRHLLGLNYLKWYKTKAIQDHLLNLNPIQKVTTKEVSIHTVLEKEPDYINDSDILFVAIGEANIETWIAKKLKEGAIKVPIFFLWVEPYLLGGHCLYVPPKCPNYDSYFDDNGLFKFNMIDADFQGNPILSEKEAGCQSDFTPYGGNSIQLFLGAMFFKISEIMNGLPAQSRSFTWVGDKTMAEELDIEISATGEDCNFGEVLSFEL
ncbi:hypothetical protein MTsPCn9_10260 [Croceitalea sp. MTPC9]|uniref:E2/UBC family protein n=1 Tax=unclassified Croceitalea TaxID=2632280 RepID=UPI002B3D1C87|nr:hypothetical protein MTsPCn6_26980 [Croceitalea sp. MTPC6]GMN16090.1 hypothetical protein MTsPCn9_10260 [Croceitalea sp. MTPC9]